MTLSSPAFKPVLLCILDGWGHRSYDHNNAMTHALEWRRIVDTYPHTFLNASESFVGLPKGQMGNSEVGHMTIGLGRIFMQDLPRITDAIDRHHFEAMPVIHDLIKASQSGSGRCHVMGLFSEGGVHSHKDHFMTVCHLLKEKGIHVVLHPILDGRDTAPKAAMASLQELDLLADTFPKAFTKGTMGGRFFAMDRDQRWDRIEKAYHVMAKGSHSKSPSSFQEVLEKAYDESITDEFVPPVSLSHYEGILPSDTLFFINFRADRARQMLSVLCGLQKLAGELFHPPFSYMATMTDYSDELSQYAHAVFPKTPLQNGLGDMVSKAGIAQLRIAETEKYAHVTYFFNGGREDPFDLEDRLLIPSPKVSTYDLEPAMSAHHITDRLIDAMAEKKYGLIVANYANADMVGHTGVETATIKAICTVDQMLKKLEETALSTGWRVIVTADHGNAETMHDQDGSAHTAHTCNLVPFVLINGNEENLRQPLDDFPLTLADIAPTILSLLGLDVPQEMTGQNLLSVASKYHG